MALLKGGSNCLRILTILFNFIVFGCGLLLLGFSSYVLYTLNNTFKDMKPQEYGVVVGFIALSFIICFIGFLGCCGACKESTCMLTCFAVIIGILLVLEITISVVGFIYREKLPKLIEEFLTNEVKNVNNGGSPTMDNIQTMFECCGVHGSSDYENGSPDTCGSATDGCLAKVENFIIKHSTTLFIVAIVVALLQLAAVIVACCLRSSIISYQTV